VEPESCTVPGDIRATIVRIFAYMGALAILAIAAASLFHPPEGNAAVEQPAASTPEWVNIDRPHPAFELQMPELGAGDYAILRRTADNARKDVLTFGALAAAGPYATVEIFRAGAAGARFIDAPSEIAARIVTFSITDDVKPAGMIESKFGAVPLVDFAIAVNNKPRRCLGFARPFDKPPMQISGWYCSPGEEAVDRATIACALDHLTSLSSGGDPSLAGLFANAELKRTFCGQRNPILAATPEHDVAEVPIPRSITLVRNSKPHDRALPH
jgi:hypothetical protein